MIKVNCQTCYSKNQCEEITTKAVWVTNDLLKVSEMAEVPYVNPIENGSAKILDKTGKPEASTFADCVETCIRHVINYVLGKDGIRDIDSNISFNGSRTRALQEFYNKHKAHPNDGTTDTRTDWNRVVFNLKPSIKYCNGINELDTGFKNMCFVLRKITGVDVKLDGLSKEEDIAAYLETAFKTLRPEKDFRIIITEAGGNQTNQKDEIYGMAEVMVQSQSTDSAYTFTIHQSLGHAYVAYKLPETFSSLSIFTPQNEISSEISDLMGYCFPYYQGQNTYHAIFSFYGSFLRDYDLFMSARILRDSNKNIKIDNILSNIIRPIPFSDVGRRKSALELIYAGSNFTPDTCKIFSKKIQEIHTVEQTVEEEMNNALCAKTVNISSEMAKYLAGILDLSKVQGLQEVEITGLGTILKSFTAPPSLKKLAIGWHSKIHTLDLSRAQNLEKLIIDDRAKLPGFTFTAPPSFKKLTIGKGVTIHTLNLSKAQNLQEVVLSEISLESFTAPSSLEILAIGWNSKIKTLDLSKAQNLQELFIGDEVKLPSFTFTAPPSLEKLTIGVSVTIDTLDLSKAQSLEKLDIDGSEISLQNVKFTGRQSLEALISDLNSNSTGR